MRTYNWKDAQGRPWEGGLMVPAGFDSGRRYPLVIQTYGYSPARFYLDGANARDGYTSGFAGRAFMRENILVLALPIRAKSGWPEGDADAIRAFMDGVNAAIEALVGEGIVDRERIGIMGWSATGERVLNQLTFSDAPIRSASIMDGDANTIFSMAVTYGANDGILARKERTNEGPPFGASMERWVRNDPALHTDCVKAVVRIETYGPWVLNNWDIYALLRRQYKATEMVVIPGGTHGLLTPSDRMISLQGNVDWHRFWLADGERTQAMLWGETEATLKAQYARWHQMVELKRADDARPGCVRKLAGR
jgi:dipeptidyl aminopeptidase/acylaminoacyl peptidase